MATSLDEDTIEDILYFARANESEDLTQCLRETASKHNLSQAAILSRAVDTNSRNTALHLACANGHFDLSKTLLSLYDPASLDLKSYVNSQNQSGNTPLHWAALNGHLEIVKSLLASGADASVLNQSGHDAVFEAEMNDKQNVADFLLKEALGLEKAVGGEEGEGDGEGEGEGEAGPASNEADEDMVDAEASTQQPTNGV